MILQSVEIDSDTIRIALAIARKFARRLPPAYDKEDLECAALEGISLARNRFDASRGRPFAPFAYSYARGMVQLAIQAQTMALFPGCFSWREVQKRGGCRDRIDGLSPLSLTLDMEDVRAAPIQTPEEWMLEFESIDEFWQILDCLDERDRRIILLDYVEEIPKKKIAAGLGVRPESLNRMTSRAVGVLRSGGYKRPSRRP